MDELGATVRRISELCSWKGVDAPAASVTRFQYCHLLASVSELARGHQARGTGANDDNLVRMLVGHGASFTRHFHFATDNAATWRRPSGRDCSQASFL